VQEKSRLTQALTPLDLRSLALFRVAIGLILICDLADRLLHSELYGLSHWRPGSSGVLSALGGAANSLAVQQTFLAVLTVAVCFYVIGYKTWLSNLATWLMLLVLHGFESRLLNSGDVLLRAFFFWSLFLPVGKRFSADAKYGREDGSTTAPRLASLALMIQIICPYFFSAVCKLHTEAWCNGYGMYYSLIRSDEAKALGLLIAGLPKFSLISMNYAVLAVELFAPFLMFSPVENARCRQFAVYLFAGFHAAMFLTLDVGQFTFICAAGWLAILPSSFWKEQPSLQAGAWMSRRADYLTLACLVLVVASNIQSLPGVSLELPSAVESVRFSLGLNQRFKMYSSASGTGGWIRGRSRWITMPGLLVDGTCADLFTNRESCSMSRPAVISDTFFSEHWRKLTEKTFRARDQETMSRMAEYFCRSWNQNHAGEKKLSRFGITLVQQHERPDGSSSAPIEENLFQQDCP